MCVQCSPDFRGEMLTAHDRRTTHPETRELWVSRVKLCGVCQRRPGARPPRRVAGQGLRRRPLVRPLFAFRKKISRSTTRSTRDISPHRLLESPNHTQFAE